MIARDFAQYQCQVEEKDSCHHKLVETIVFEFNNQLKYGIWREDIENIHKQLIADEKIML